MIPAAAARTVQCVANTYLNPPPRPHAPRNARDQLRRGWPDLADALQALSDQLTMEAREGACREGVSPAVERLAWDVVDAYQQPGLVEDAGLNAYLLHVSLPELARKLNQLAFQLEEDEQP